MSTLTGLVGGGGGDKVATSLAQVSSSFLNNYSASATLSSTTLVNIVNISGVEGYLMAAFLQGFGFSTSRCIITIDGTTILDATGSVSSVNAATFPEGESCSIWPMGAFRAINETGQIIDQYMRVGGNLRFESSLRVQMNKATGPSNMTGKAMYYLT